MEFIIIFSSIVVSTLVSYAVYEFYAEKMTEKLQENNAHLIKTVVDIVEVFLKTDAKRKVNASEIVDMLAVKDFTLKESLKMFDDCKNVVLSKVTAGEKLTDKLTKNKGV